MPTEISISDTNFNDWNKKQREIFGRTFDSDKFEKKNVKHQHEP